MSYKIQRYFDVVILIDCWEKDFFNLHNPPLPGIDDFYTRMVQKLSTMRFDNVALATHPTPGYAIEPSLIKNISSLTNKNPTFKQVTSLQQLFARFPQLLYNTKLNILIAGLSWCHCVHWRDLGIVNLLHNRYQIYTHHDLVYREGDTVPWDRDEILQIDNIVQWDKSNDLDETIRAVNTNGDMVKWHKSYIKNTQKTPKT